jgi:collagen type I alpha
VTGTTISTKVTIGVTLGVGTYASPLTITSLGEIAPIAYSAKALEFSGGGNYATNSGTIIGGVGASPAYGSSANGGNGGQGAYFGNGSLTNYGVILGGGGGTGSTNSFFGGIGGYGGDGAEIGNAATLNNFGTITGGSGGVGGSGSAIPGGGGTGGIGVYVVANSGSPATLVNSGDILGGVGGAPGHSESGAPPAAAGGDGVLFRNGGTLTNSLGIAGGANYGGGRADAVYFGLGSALLILQPGAQFSGSVVANPTFAYSNVMELAAGFGLNTLSGAIGSEYTGFGTVLVDPSANWTLSAANTIAEGSSLVVEGTLANIGTITGSGGTAANYGSGSAGGTGVVGVDVSGGTLVNSARVAGGGGGAGATGGAFAGNGGTGGIGVNLVAGSLINRGTVSGRAGGYGGNGVDTGGYGGNGGVAVYAQAGQVTNQATIVGGAGGSGGRGGSGGGIFAANGNGGVGVVFPAGGTLIDAGVIAGGTGASGTADAVYFGTGASHLILDPGASFVGSVVANASFANALELASGSGVGTLSGVIGAEYTGFTTVAVEPGANWTLSGTNTIAQGSYLATFGTLGNIGKITGAAGTSASYGSENAGGNGIRAVAVIAGGTFNNSSIAMGGAGGNGASDGYATSLGGNGGDGAVGVVVQAGSLINEGTISGGAGGNGGADVSTGGVGGRGGTGVYVQTGQITNLGTIQGGTGGSGGSNAESMHAASGVGGMGIQFGFGGTLIDAGIVAGGTFGGGVADAVYFGSGASRLILNSGAAFVGTVVGNTSFANVLELASGATQGTLSGLLGSDFVGFSSYVVDPGAVWHLSGSNTIVHGGTLSESGGAVIELNTGVLVNSGAISLDASLLFVQNLVGTGATTIGGTSEIVVMHSLATAQTVVFNGSAGYLQLSLPSYAKATVTNFSHGDQIALNGVNPAAVVFAGGTLSFGIGSFPLSLGGPGTVTATTDGGGAIVTVSCFRAGTRIATVHGDVAVETLAIGDRVVLADGEALSIEWIGHRHIDCTRHPRPQSVWPVCIKAGAFGNGLPRRDLYLSPDHAVYIHGVLIPVRYLINNETIVQVLVRDVTYYHVQLERHDVLLAEGLPAESYLGDQQDFDDANLVRLFPDFASRDWEAHGCAPLIVAGPLLAAVRDMLACVREDPTHERSPRAGARRAG